jgi:SNF2 family DNA or RNA helicase
MPPHVLWLRTDAPPKIGQMLEVTARHTHTSVGSGSVTVLEGGALRVVPDVYARRVVSPHWVRLCHTASAKRLFPHQAEGAGWLAERLARGVGAILADSPGLGKTIQAIVAARAASKLPCVIVCPASVKRQWAAEVSSLRGRYITRIVRGLEGPIRPSHFIVVNYDLIGTREQQLTSLGAKLVIWDECHTLKEPQPERTHRASVATRISKAIGLSLLLTGTPVLNRGTELWRLLHIADPNLWPSFGEFRAEYCADPDEDAEGPVVARKVVTTHGHVTKLDKLHAFAGRCVLRRTKRDVLRTLPAKVHRRVRVELEPADMAAYRSAEQDVVSWLLSLGKTAAARSAARGRTVVKINMLRRIAAAGKLRAAVPDYLRRWMDHVHRTLLVFAYHRHAVDGVAAICRGLGMRSTGIHGSDNDAQRQAAVNLFNAGKADVFIAPIRSAGVGLNLQRACSDVLFVEQLWTPSLMEQAADRVHRLGQTRQVTVTVMDAVGTIDEHMGAVIDAKRAVIDAIVDDRTARDDAQERVEAVDEVVELLIRTETG